ncbi:MAG: DUF3108 domain-containing protein [Porticoccaceae bacterium]|nr:DUF3108 domain-containing protein [Porticoccaceae bacterium]
MILLRLLFILAALTAVSLQTQAGGGSTEVSAGAVAPPTTILDDDVALAADSAKPGTADPSADDGTGRVAEPMPLKLPAPYEASYSASYNGLAIKNKRSLSTTANGYLLTTKAENFLGTISEEEHLEIDSSGNIIPQQYHYKRSIFGVKRTESTAFNRQKGIVTNTYKDRTVELALEKSLLTPLSYQLQMRQDLLQGKSDFQYRVVSRNGIKDYHYRVIDAEILDTPLGKLDTLIIKRIRDSNKRETYLWLAKSLDYLPVKLTHKEDGETHEMLIKSYKDLSVP